MNTAYKKLTSHGSISIPVAMRREMGIEPKDPMMVSSQGKKIVIEPYQQRCTFCLTTDNVKDFNGKGICIRCAKQITDYTEGNA